MFRKPIQIIYYENEPYKDLRGYKNKPPSVAFPEDSKSSWTIKYQRWFAFRFLFIFVQLHYIELLFSLLSNKMQHTFFFKCKSPCLTFIQFTFYYFKSLKALEILEKTTCIQYRAFSLMQDINLSLSQKILQHC